MDSTDRLCLHTITTRPWPIETAAVKYSKAGIRGISIWREALEGTRGGESAPSRCGDGGGAGGGRRGRGALGKRARENPSGEALEETHSSEPRTGGIREDDRKAIS